VGALGNPKHEIFAQHVAAGMRPRDAYTRAGFEPSRANFHRLMKKPHVARRIAELISDRDRIVAAARMQPEEILQILRGRVNIDRVADFFEINGVGLRVRDLREVPVECATAFIRLARVGFGLPADFETVPEMIGAEVCNRTLQASLRCSSEKRKVT
jgi:hypothetical protein